MKLLVSTAGVLDILTREAQSLLSSLVGCMEGSRNIGFQNFNKDSKKTTERPMCQRHRQQLVCRPTRI